MVPYVDFNNVVCSKIERTMLRHSRKQPRAIAHGRGAASDILKGVHQQARLGTHQTDK